jgi:hypothetical protein
MLQYFCKGSTMPTEHTWTEIQSDCSPSCISHMHKIHCKSARRLVPTHVASRVHGPKRDLIQWNYSYQENRYSMGRSLKQFTKMNNNYKLFPKRHHLCIWVCGINSKFCDCIQDRPAWRNWMWKTALPQTFNATAHLPVWLHDNLIELNNILYQLTSNESL